MLPKLYTGLLVIVALFAMAALGMLMLVVIMHIGDLAISTNKPAGMNHWVCWPLPERASRRPCPSITRQARAACARSAFHPRCLSATVARVR